MESAPIRDDDDASNRARFSNEPVRKPYSEKSADEIERDIAHTRSEMSETLNAIEHRLSPAHLKHEVQDTLHETVHHVLDSVQDRFHPKRLARNAGRDMIDTIKDNPIPSLIAGLSIGWLLFKSNDSDGHDERYAYRRVRAHDRPDYGTPSSVHNYPTQGYREQARFEESRTGGRSWNYRDGYDGRSNPASAVQERASQAAQQARDQASQAADQAREHAEDFGRQVYRGARRTQNTLDQFIHDNPLAAGAIAAGIGALLGGLLPSTSQEDQWMGEQRDQLVHKAERVAEQALDEAKSSAQTVKNAAAEEAKSAVQSVKETAQAEARQVKEAAFDAAEQQHFTSGNRNDDQDQSRPQQQTRDNTGEERPSWGTSRASL